MKKCVGAIALMAVGILIPSLMFAQDTGGGLGSEIKSLHSVLDEIYGQMLPLCSKLIGVGRGIAGFAAMWYIAARVWRHIVNAEPIDFYPLFRPFSIGMVVLLWPSTIAVINGVMKPTVTATSAMVTDSDKAVADLLKLKEEAIKQTIFWQMYVGDNGSGDRDKWYVYTHPKEKPEDEGFFESIGNDVRFAMAKFSYNFRNSIKQWMSEVLQILFLAASLCINTIRTFYLIVLAIIGPLAFGISVFDGLHHTLTNWIARYLNIFLWLPVANIFGAIIGQIQINMLKLDISQIQQQGDTFFSSTDAGYLVFMIIGIIGFFTVPSVANYIIHAGGGNALASRVSGFGGSVVSTTTSAATNVISQAGQGIASGASSAMQAMNQPIYFEKSYSDGSKESGGFLAHRLSGKNKNT